MQAQTTTLERITEQALTENAELMLPASVRLHYDSNLFIACLIAGMCYEIDRLNNRKDSE